jgi:ATP-binding cassette subfamily C protein CydD
VIPDPIRQVPGIHRMLVFVAGLGLLAGAASVIQAMLLGEIIGHVFPYRPSLAAVALPLVLLAAAGVVRAVLLWTRDAAAGETAILVRREVRRLLLAHIVRLGPTHTRGERTGELVTTATEGIDRLVPFASRYLPQVILTVTLPALIAIVILPVDWVSSVLLAATVPIIPILMLLIGGQTETLARKQWQALSRLSALFLDTMHGLPTIILFGRVEAERKRLAESSERLRSATIRVLRLAAMSGAMLELMTSLAIGVVAVALALRLVDGGITFQRAILVFFLTPEFYRPLRDLGIHYHAGREGRAAAERICTILATPPSVHAVHTATLPAPPIQVTFADVSYRYPDGTCNALDHVDLVLPANRCTALVGRSGAGKSTLLYLLLRFTDPTEGKIVINGVSLAELPPEEWRRSVAVVPQRPHLFAGSIEENIRLVRPDAADRAFRRACDLAGVYAFASSLPAGTATILGQRGGGVSAGQSQRIAIARAILKDAPLLILDEPTSSLDPETEESIRLALDVLRRDRTVLVIAHRLNTVISADQIAVLDEGRIVEQGTHSTLVAANGPYAGLICARPALAVP